MKKLILIFTLGLVLTSLKSQTYTYNYYYDNSGNRVERLAIEVPNLAGASIYDPQTQSLKDAANKDNQFNDELSGFTITLYPNPTRGEIVIRILPFIPEATGTLKVYGLDGKIIYTVSQFQEYNVIDLTEVIPGNYILKLSIGSKEKTYMIIRK